MCSCLPVYPNLGRRFEMIQSWLRLLLWCYFLNLRGGIQVTFWEWRIDWNHQTFQAFARLKKPHGWERNLLGMILHSNMWTWNGNEALVVRWRFSLKLTNFPGFRRIHTSTQFMVDFPSFVVMVLRLMLSETCQTARPGRHGRFTTMAPAGGHECVETCGYLFVGFNLKTSVFFQVTFLWIQLGFFAKTALTMDTSWIPCSHVLEGCSWRIRPRQLHSSKFKRNNGTRMANNKCRHKLMLIGPFGQTSSLNSALSHSLIEQNVPFFRRTPQME